MQPASLEKLVEESYLKKKFIQEKKKLEVIE